MVRILEAVIDTAGNVGLLEPVDVKGMRRKPVTVLDEEWLPANDECARRSARALAEDWNRPEEDVTWSLLKS